MSDYDFDENYEDAYEEIYEDELDRMRQRRRFQADEFDFEEIDLQDSRILNPEQGHGHRKRRLPLERAADRYMLEETEGTDMNQRRNPANGGQKSRTGNRAGRSNAVVSTAAGQRKRRKKKQGKILKLVLLILLLTTTVLYAKRWMKDRDGYWNVAVFGVDSRDSNLGKGALADVQMIASINKKTGEIRLVSVYRDTYVQINEEGDFHKINEAYFKGGPEQALHTLKRNLDITVDDYATFNWKAVADAINILGGIDLEITDKEFAYINSFITETVESTGVYSTHLEHAGMNHLDGVQAVAYSRLRLMDTDFNRTERQRKVVFLALEKAKQANLKTLKTVVGTVIPEISTSIGVEDVIPLAKDAKHYYLGQTGGFPFAKTTAKVKKMDCVIPMTLESNVTLLHQFLFDEEDYQPSGSVKAISAKISEKTGIYEEGKASGADKNLSGDSKNMSGGNTSDSHGGSGSGTASASTEPVSSETTAAIAETSDAETTVAETSGTEQIQENVPDEDDSETGDLSNDSNHIEVDSEGTAENESGTGITIIEPMKPDEPQNGELTDEQIKEGPGTVKPDSGNSGTNVNHSKPTEAVTEAFGPGFE